jgi:hypothetical protein
MKHWVAIAAAVIMCGTAGSGRAGAQGLVFEEDTTYQSIPLASMPLMGTPPDESDLSASFPTPGMQGGQGSCVGWAVAYALKSSQEQTERSWGLTDETHLFSPAFIYNQIRLSKKDCTTGARFTDAFNLLRRDGAASLADFPYDEASCHRMPDDAMRARAREFGIGPWRRVNVQDEIEIKTWIASGSPVLIGMTVDEGFQALGSGQIYKARNGTTLGGHALVVTGYSDSKNAFKVINSWSTDWADGGFGWIDYDIFRSTVSQAYVADDVAAYRQDSVPNQAPPVPVPEPSSPAVTIAGIEIINNVPVPAPPKPQPAPGMRVRISGIVTDAANQTLQIIVRFNYRNGPPLLANPQEGIFRDVGGLAATSTQPITIGTNSEDLSRLEISIPYYALNFAPTNGMNFYDLQLSAVVLVDNQQVAQSMPAYFQLRY